MAIVKSKEPSASFIRIAAPNAEQGRGRPSIGMEDSVKEYFYIKLDALIPFKNQARTHFDEEEIQLLADSIKNYGVRQPLTIVKSPAHFEKFEIISGERRAKAAKLSGLEKVPCIIIDDYKEAESVALIENIHRSDLHPVELARAYDSLLKNGSFPSAQELWQALGVNRSSAYETLKILELPEEVQRLLIENNIINRDKIRLLLRANDPQKAMCAMITPSPTQSGTVRNLSVMRIGFKDGNFSTQCAALKKLSSEDRKKLKMLLTDIIRSL